jgi:hypothetical protein
MTTISSRALHLDVDEANRAVASGPVVVTTDQDKPSFVLLSINDYQGSETKPLSAAPQSQEFLSLFDAIAMKGGEHLDIDFDPPKLNIELRVPDLSD